MEMKIVRRVAPTVLIMYLAIREFFFFSSKISTFIPQHDDDQHQSSSSIFRIFIYAKPSYLVIFFTFNILVVAVLLGISSQLSRFSASSYIELSILSFIDSCEGIKRVKDEDHGEYEDDFIPRMVYVDYEEEKSQGDSYNIGTNSYSRKDEDEDEDVYGPYGYGYHEYKDDFIPGIVHVEYREEKVESKSIDDSYSKKDVDTVNDDNDDNDDDREGEDEILSCDEYDYDEEDMMMSEEGSYSELDDFDLNKRIEEFIDENNKKWREELQNERLLIEFD